MSSRILLCALLLVASSTSVMAANDGAPNATTNTAPAPPTISPQSQPGAPTCRKASTKPRPQLTADQIAARKALRAQRAAQGMTHVAKPHAARLPLC